MIYESGEDVWASDVSVPVRFECEAEGEEPVSFDARVRTDSVKLRISDENLCIDAELSISGDCLGQTLISCVDKVIMGDALAGRDSEIIVCYPSNEDTVWSIAKRYHVRPEAVCGDPKTDKYILID